MPAPFDPERSFLPSGRFGRRLLPILPLIGARPARAQRLRHGFDQDSGSIGFTFRHLLVLTASGRFERFRGMLMLDPAHPLTMGVDCLLDMTAVTVSLPGATERLRSEPFFDVANFPEARFRGEADGTGDAEAINLLGQLLLRGVTRPFQMRGRLFERQPGSARFQAEGELLRSDYGISADRPLISDRIQLKVDVRVSL